FIEVWNLVFMQFEQFEGGAREPLPKPSIDTGMGLERLTAILQGKHDNYDIDMMRALIEASAEATGVAPDGPQHASHKVIADHLRSSAFLIADGVLPSNEGRGYVLRRIMRRAMRHAHMLGARDPVMHLLVPTLVHEMGQAYQELVRAEALISETLELEEKRFKQTLDRGLKLLTEETDKLGDAEALPGEVAFKLYDTYGFPVDLTADILRGQGRALDTAGFEAAMDQQKAAARAAWAGSGEAATEQVWFDLRDQHGATDFLGYAAEAAEGQILALVKDGAPADSANNGESVAVIVNQTPFYGESGGQIGDTGEMRTPGGARFRVTDTQKKLGDLHVHFGVIEHGYLAVGEAVELAVDHHRRTALRAHHSATHLLHEALRRRLGEHVTQKGSLVAPDRLRFDISQPKPLTGDDVAEVEAAVNAHILANDEVITRLMTPDDAIAEGAMALFGEKYGDEVRVVSMGGLDDAKSSESGAARYYSTELCGGTHVRRTGDIGFFKIVGEEALAAGVRRIEALAGEAAAVWANQQAALLAEVASALKAAPAEIPGRVASLIEERRKLEREVKELRHKLATGGGGAAAADVREIAGVGYIGRVVDVSPKDLKPLADDLKKQVGTGVVAIATANDGKASIVVGVTEDATDRFSAVDLVRVGSAALGGKGGGGRADMAQAGGPDGGAAQQAIDAIADAMASAAE
nr:alanine--tRNA ligase [Alphaproteobacteria bacterium]